MKPKSQNIQGHDGNVTQSDREGLLGQRGCALWFTGLSGSGKSTLARAVEARLQAMGRLSYVLDGDNLRTGLCANLGFSPEDRSENIRRVGELAALFVDAGVITLTAFISPYRSDRELARKAVGVERFLEVFLDVSLATCEARDPKGLYQKARAGELSEFTGISAPYEAPKHPTLRIDGALVLEDSVARVLGTLEERGFLPPPVGPES